ncbi:MAG: translocation/assembly module TamB domain-containing protein [Alphaproteobacteria bacterium]|nr:translocation/assembly module TamB domain-containing protein [Alphaproteobacteria bacterium]
MAVGSVLGTLGVIGLVHTPWFRQRVVRVIEDVAERATGERVVIGGLRLDLPRRSVHLDGVVVRHKSPLAERDGRTIVAIQQVTLALGLRGGKPRLQRLELDRPSVSLHLDEGRLREFPGLRGGGGKKPEELPWDALYVRDGAFSLEATYGDDALAALRIEGLDATPAEQPHRMIVDAGVVEVAVGDFVQAASAVHLPGLEVTPDRIVAPRVALDFPDIDVDGWLDLQPQGPVSGLFTVSTELSALTPLFPGRVTAAGPVDVDLELSGESTAPALRGVLLARELTLFVAPPASDPTRPQRTYALGDVEGQLRLVERQLHLEPLRVAWAGGDIVIRGAADLASQGAWASITGQELSLYQALQATDASPDPWVDLGGDLEIQAAGTLSPLRLAGSWKLAGTNLAVASGPVHREAHLLDIPRILAEGEIHLLGDELRLLARPLGTPRSSGRVDARIGLGPQGPLDLTLDLPRLALADLAPLGDIELGGTAWLHGRLWGDFDDLQVAGDTRIQDFVLFGLPFADIAEGPIESPDLVSLRFPDVRAQRGDTPWRGSVGLDFGPEGGLDLQLLIGEGRLSDVTSIFLDLGEVEATTQGTLELRGPFDALDGEARVSLRDIGLYGEHFDSGSAVGWMDGGRFTLDEAVLSRAGGAETLVARGSVGAGWATNIDVHGNGFRVEDMDLLAGLGGRLRGAATVDAVVGGTLFEPEPRGRLSLTGTHVGRQPLGDSALAFRTADGVMAFDGQLAGPGLAVEGTLGLWDAQPYAITAAFHDFPLHALYPEAPDGSPITARISGDAELGGHFGDTPSPVAISAHVTDTLLQWGRHSLVAPVPWTWSQSGEDFRLSDLSLQGGRTRLAFAGERHADGPTRFLGGGTVDLDLARAVVPGLTLAEGTAIVELDILGDEEGGRAEPRLRATADGVTVRGDWFPARFEDMSVSAAASAGGYDIQHLTGRLGGGTVDGQGRIDAEGWAPRRYDLRGRVRDGRVRYFDFLPAAIGDADITFQGPSDSPLLAGRVTVKDMLYSDRIDWESWVLEVSDEVLSSAVEADGEDWFDIDLQLSSADTIRVRNNVADLTASAELHVIGDTALPGLEGWVRASPGGRVYLKEREFELLRGELRFVDPYAYDPELDFALSTTVEGMDQDVDIAVQVDGRWSSWGTEMRSDPSLAQADINALLLFGMTREEMERSGALGQALAVEGGDVLFSSIGVVQRAEEGIFRLRGLEPLLAPLRPDRLDLVSGTSERGSGTLNSELRLLYENDLWDGGQLIYEQNIVDLDDQYVALEQRLARRLYLRGWWSREQIDRTLSIGGAYGLEVNLRWELDW